MVDMVMAKIDSAMLTTRADKGRLATRPMGNNGEVEYGGDGNDEGELTT